MTVARFVRAIADILGTCTAPLRSAVVSLLLPPLMLWRPDSRERLPFERRFTPLLNVAAPVAAERVPLSTETAP